MKDIAIIGVAGRFPEAANILEFRRNLITGRDCIRDFSFERKANTTLALDKEFMTIGFVEDVDKFDHKFFNISKAEAENMDPHQRMLMEVVYEAVESAGYNIDELNGSETAVFISDTEQPYGQLSDQFDPTQITGTLSAATAGRISRFFNFRGTAAMVDTACSSSLMAVHMACNELVMGDASYALAAGVRFILFPEEKRTTPDLGIMSADGRTRSFDAKAAGSGAGEATGCVLLKPLDKAMEDGDIIYAIIKGTAANQDAQLSGSLTAPSSQAQSEVIRKVWKKSNVDPLSVSYIEAHGSGTKLGDPIEIGGIDLAFKGLTDQKHFIAVSSIKSNIGHTGGAAGISGLIKAVLSLQHKELYPSVHFHQPNPFIDFKNSVVYVNAAYKPWEAAFPRRAGVSSFGISGTNCHVLLEEAPPAVVNEQPGTFIFNYSAKSTASLKAYLEDFTGYINEADKVSLADISYTLNKGRKHYAHRVSVTASSAAALVQQLQNAVITQASEPVKKIIFLFSGDATLNKEMVAAEPGLKKYMDECTPYYTAPHPATDRFVLQYALYRWLEEKGISTENLLGIGTGDLVVAAILNELTLEEAIRQCQDEENIAGDLAPKLMSLVERETADGKVAFVEMGSKGALSEGLLQLHYPDKEFLYTVVQAVNTPLEIIQALYLQQFPIDWANYYAGTNSRKVTVPAYHFEKTRCWLRPVLKAEDFAANVTATPVTAAPVQPEQASDPSRHQSIIRDNWTDMEKKIAAIWIDVLKLEELTLQDDFFRLGGHSLMATKVIATIEKEFGIRLIFKDIFTFATVKSLAKGVEEIIAAGGQKTVYPAIRPAAPQPFYPLSEAQRRLWLISQSSENTIAYNLPSMLMLEGKLDIPRLESVFRTLVNRHESLRTSFHEKNAQPVQTVHAAADVTFSIQQLQPSQDTNDILQEFLQPFDLTKAPLFRVGLASLQPDKHVLLFDMHHIISDGVSLGVLINELVKLYDGETLPAVSIQYKDVVLWQEELFKNGLMAKQERFWIDQFAGGVPVLQLQTDKPRPATQDFSGSKLVFELPVPQVQAIRQLASTTGTTPFMLLLAVYNVLLHKYTHQEDIVVGSPIAGRPQSDLGQVVGMFVNTLVLRNQPAAGKTFLQFLQEVKERALNAYEHQDYPFALLVDKLDLKKDAARNPLFDMMFVLQNLDMPEIKLGDLTISGCPVNMGTSQFDLLLEINESKAAWPVKLEYNTALFEAESILLMKERLLVLLQDVLEHPEKPISELSFRIAAETVSDAGDLDFAFNF